MIQQDSANPPPAPMSDASASTGQADFGALLHARQYAATGYIVAAAFLFLVPTVALGSVVLFSEPSPGVAPASAGEKLVIMAIIILIAGAGASVLLIKGLRKRGTAIRAYERGICFVSKSRKEAACRYAQIKEIKARTQASGALIRATFILADGQSYTASVHGPKDVQMLKDVFARCGSISWVADSHFRM